MPDIVANFLPDVVFDFDDQLALMQLPLTGTTANRLPTAAGHTASANSSGASRAFCSLIFESNLAARCMSSKNGGGKSMNSRF